MLVYAFSLLRTYRGMLQLHLRSLRLTKYKRDNAKRSPRKTTVRSTLTKVQT